jgi:putative integral membrane protein (TIGR02587 family)
MSPTRDSPETEAPQPGWMGVGRAIGGAVVFGLPLMMTMEMWWLGFYIDPVRLIVLIVVSLPLLVGVSSLIGFTASRNLTDNIIDVFVAYGFGFVVSGIVLYLFSGAASDYPAGINFTAVMLQTVPASLGALLARSELGRGEHDRTAGKSAIDRLVVLAIGALFLALNVAPTEEIHLIANRMTPWHQLALFSTTLLVMYIFTVASSVAESREPDSYQSEQDNTEAKESKSSQGGKQQTHIDYLRYTCIAFVVALAASALMLWVFDHFDGLASAQILANVVVLLFPAGIGAAAARFII